MRPEREPARIEEIIEPACGLHAFIVLDDLTLGPAAGGIRTLSYPSPQAALSDARRLARAMTLKCALSGLDTGGGKGVVMAHPGLRRSEAFQVLGERIEAMNGDFRTAGDMGTTLEDLRWMARTTGYVHTNETALTEAVARGLQGCMSALLPMLGL